jgi:hypothetical protein
MERGCLARAFDVFDHRPKRRGRDARAPPSFRYAPQVESRTDAHPDIDRLIAAFFALFSNRGGAQPNLAGIHELFVPEGVIAKCVDVKPEVSTLDDFIAPREQLLTSGALTDFEEVETSHQTEVFGHIARRVSMYRKSGVRDGAPFVTHGVKIFQLVETPQGWRILSMAWDDEREGFRRG